MAFNCMLSRYPSLMLITAPRPRYFRLSYLIAIFVRVNSGTALTLRRHVGRAVPFMIVTMQNSCPVLTSALAGGSINQSSEAVFYRKRDYF